MVDKILSYAEQVFDGTNLLEILQDLKDIFSKNSLFYEETACLEKIYHITFEPDLYKEIGNIFLYKLRDKKSANMAYNTYLYHSMPEFFSNYSESSENEQPEYFEETRDTEIIHLCDKFEVLVFIIIYLHKIKQYDGILKASEYLKQAKQLINDYKESNPSNTDAYYPRITAIEEHLSDILSTTCNNNDINNLAITLNKSNQKAYINIIDDMLFSQNYNNALDFYNDFYCPNFNTAEQYSITDVCWIISDYYRDIYNFYDAVKLQKLALELENINYDEGRIH